MYVTSLVMVLAQILTVKLLFSNVNETSMNSSDNSTDSSEGSPTGGVGTVGQFEGPNPDMERLLPSAVNLPDECQIENV